MTELSRPPRCGYGIISGGGNPLEEETATNTTTKTDTAALQRVETTI